MTTLVSQLAGGKPAFRARLGGFEPIGFIGRGCHAGAGHDESVEHGAFGRLCCACWESVCRVLGRQP